MPCLCPATDRVFCYFRQSQCPSPYFWDGLGNSGWGYCLTSNTSSLYRTMACVSDTLPPNIQAMIQQSEQYQQQMEHLASQPHLSTGDIVGLCVGLGVGVGLLVWFYIACIRSRRICSNRNRTILRQRNRSDAEQSSETSLTILANQRSSIPKHSMINPIEKKSMNPLKAGKPQPSA